MEPIYKKISNENFYLLAFVVGMVLFIGFQLVFMLVAAFVVEFQQPGFFEDFFLNYLEGNTLDLTQTNVAILNVSQMIGELLLAGLFIAILGKELKKDWVRAIDKSQIGRNLAIIALGFVSILFVTYGLNIVYEFFQIEGTSDNQELIEAVLKFDSRIFMIITTILLAPFVEEILFRKFLFGILEVKLHLKPIWAVILSAAIFAGIHSIDLFFFQYFALALILSISYAASKNNIFVSMGLHFVNNAMTIIAFFAYEGMF